MQNDIIDRMRQVEIDKQDFIANALASSITETTVTPYTLSAKTAREYNQRGQALVKALKSRGLRESEIRDHVSNAIAHGVYAVQVVDGIRAGMDLEEAHVRAALITAKVRRCPHGNSLAMDLCTFVVLNGGTPKTAKDDLNTILHGAECARQAMPEDIRQQLAAIQARKAQDLLELLKNPEAKV